jgi:hypothetical protein
MQSSGPIRVLDVLSRLEQVCGGKQDYRRRRHARHVVRGEAILLQLDRTSSDEPPITVMLRDVGRGGVGFIAQRSVAVGSLKRLRLLQRDYGIGEVDVMIQHCALVEDPVYLIGCEVCFNNGQMLLLGVDPATISTDDQAEPGRDAASFLAPDEVV